MYQFRFPLAQTLSGPREIDNIAGKAGMKNVQTSD